MYKMLYKSLGEAASSYLNMAFFNQSRVLGLRRSVFYLRFEVDCKSDVLKRITNLSIINSCR